MNNKNNLVVSPNGEDIKKNEIIVHSPNGEQSLSSEIVPSFSKLEYYQMLSIGIDLKKMDEMSQAEWNKYVAGKLDMSVRTYERIGYISKYGLESWIEIIAGKEEHKGGRFSYSNVCEIVSVWDRKAQTELIRLWREDKICLKKFLEITKSIKKGVPYIPQFQKRTFLKEVKTKFGTFTLKMETPELRKETYEEVLPVVMKAIEELHEDLFGEEWQSIYRDEI